MVISPRPHFKKKKLDGHICPYCGHLWEAHYSEGEAENTAIICSHCDDAMEWILA